MNYLPAFLTRDPNSKARFYLVHMSGIINTNMTYKVYKALKKFDGDKARGIAVVINSQGGSPAQAYVI